MALKVKTLAQPMDFIPPSQKGEENPAKFRIRPLTGAELLDVQGEVDEEKNTVTGKGVRFAIKNGLTGWENVEDEDGNAIPFTPNGALLFLDHVMLVQIASKIMEISVLKEGAAKN